MARPVWSPRARPPQEDPALNDDPWTERTSAARSRPLILPDDPPDAGRPAHSAHSAAEDPGDLEGDRRLELVVSARLRRLVRTPSLERRRMPETVALEVVVGHLHHALRAKWLPRQVLATVPPRRRAGEALA